MCPMYSFLRITKAFLYFLCAASHSLKLPVDITSFFIFVKRLQSRSSPTWPVVALKARGRSKQTLETTGKTINPRYDKHLPLRHKEPSNGSNDRSDEGAQLCVCSLWWAPEKWCSLKSKDIRVCLFRVASSLAWPWWDHGYRGKRNSRTSATGYKLRNSTAKLTNSGSIRFRSRAVNTNQVDVRKPVRHTFDSGMVPDQASSEYGFTQRLSTCMTNFEHADIILYYFRLVPVAALTGGRKLHSRKEREGHYRKCLTRSRLTPSRLTRSRLTRSRLICSLFEP